MLEVEQISFPHLQWIYYREALDCIDSNGQHVQMEHAYHRGEFEFEGHKPDGYLFKDGKHHFYEFRGNYSPSQIPFYYFKAAIGMVVLAFLQVNGLQMSKIAILISKKKLLVSVPMVKSI